MKFWMKIVKDLMFGCNCLLPSNGRGLKTISKLLSIALIFGLTTASVFFADTTSAVAQQVPPDDGEQLPVRGIVRPSERAKISTGLSTKVIKVAYDEGRSFKKGDLLIEFDCRLQEAELASYLARQREMVIGLKSALYLKKRNAGSLYDVEVARAKMAKAKADANGVENSTVGLPCVCSL